MTVLIIIIIAIGIGLYLYASMRKKQTQTMPSFANTKAEKGGYWEGFKRRKPEQAKQIEIISGRDMSNLDDVSVFQIVTSLTYKIP